MKIHNPRHLTEVRKFAMEISHFLFIALLMVGCAESPEEKAKVIAKAIGLDDYKIIAEAIDEKRLRSVEQSDELNGSGGGDIFYIEGTQEVYIDGKRPVYSGWSKSVDSDGQIRALSRYKDGRKDGLWRRWYPSGQKESESTWQDGKLMTAVVWKPDGAKCPVTNVVNGNGVWGHYQPDGNETAWCETYAGGRVW